MLLSLHCSFFSNTVQGNTQREFCTESTLNLKDTHLIWLAQTAEASYHHQTKGGLILLPITCIEIASAGDFSLASLNIKNDYSKQNLFYCSCGHLTYSRTEHIHSLKTCSAFKNLPLQTDSHSECFLTPTVNWTELSLLSRETSSGSGVVLSLKWSRTGSYRRISASEA